MYVLRLLIRTLSTIVFIALGTVAAPAGPGDWTRVSYPAVAQALSAQPVSLTNTARAPPTTRANVTSAGAARAQTGNLRAFDGVESGGLSVPEASKILLHYGEVLAANDGADPQIKAALSAYRFVIASGHSRPSSSALKLALGNKIRGDGNAGADGGGTNKTLLIEDLVAGGTRITPENVVDIRSINGRTVWLETGDANAGLRHIVGEHGPEFSQRGISEAEIPDVIFTALQRNNVVGHQGRGTGRPIYEFDYGGQTHRLAITVGDNGFVVGANFR